MGVTIDDIRNKVLTNLQKCSQYFQSTNNENQSSTTTNSPFEYNTIIKQLSNTGNISTITTIYQNCAIQLYNSNQYSVGEKLFLSCSQLIKCELKLTNTEIIKLKLYKCLYVRCKCIILLVKQYVLKHEITGVPNLLTVLRQAVDECLLNSLTNNKSTTHNTIELYYELCCCHTLYAIELQHTQSIQHFIAHITQHTIPHYHLYIQSIQQTHTPTIQYITKSIEQLDYIQSVCQLYGILQLHIDCIQLSRQLCTCTQQYNEYNQYTIQLALLYQQYELYDLANQICNEWDDTQHGNELSQLYSILYNVNTIRTSAELNTQLQTIQQIHTVIDSRIQITPGAKSLNDVELIGVSYYIQQHVYHKQCNYSESIELGMQCVMKCKAILKSFNRSIHSDTNHMIEPLLQLHNTGNNSSMTKQTTIYNILYLMSNTLHTLTDIYNETGQIKLAEYYSSILLDEFVHIPYTYSRTLLQCMDICYRTGEYNHMKSLQGIFVQQAENKQHINNPLLTVQHHTTQIQCSIQVQQYDSARQHCKDAIECITCNSVCNANGTDIPILPSTLIHLQCYKHTIELYTLQHNNTATVELIRAMIPHTISLLNNLAVHSVSDLLIQSRILLLLGRLYVQYVQLQSILPVATPTTNVHQTITNSSVITNRTQRSRVKPITDTPGNQSNTTQPASNMELYDITQHIHPTQYHDIQQHQLYNIELNTRSIQYSHILQYAYKCIYVVLCHSFVNTSHLLLNEAIGLLTNHILSINPHDINDIAVYTFINSLQQSHYTRMQLLTVLQTKSNHPSPCDTPANNIDITNDILFVDLNQIFNDLTIDEPPSMTTESFSSATQPEHQSTNKHMDVVQQQIDRIEYNHGLHVEYTMYEQLYRQLPPQWKLIQVTLHNTHTCTLSITQHNQSSSIYQYDIPINGITQLITKHNCILQSSDTLNSSTKHMTNITNADRKQWWDQRNQLDHDMKQLLSSIESTLFGYHKMYLLGAYCNHMLLSQIHQQSIQLHTQLNTTIITQPQLQFIMSSYTCLSPNDIKQYIRSVQSVRTVHNQFESDLLHIVSQIQVSCEQLYSDVLIYMRQQSSVGHRPMNTKKPRRTRSVGIDDHSTTEVPMELLDKYQREPIILILSNIIQPLPIESIPTLRYCQSVSRIPSIPILHTLLMSKFNAINHTTGIINGYNSAHTYYVLNPSNDLHKTEQTFKSKFQLQKDWTGCIGSIPNDIQEQLQTKHQYIYCGHSAGEQIISYNTINTLYVKPIVMLMGCSSARLKPQQYQNKLFNESIDGTNDMNIYNQYDLIGISQSYLLNGSSCVIGNLYDVTDGDIDRYTDELLSHTCYDDASCTHTIQHVVSRARSVCKLPYLIGCAPVVYGLPTIIHH